MTVTPEQMFEMVEKAFAACEADVSAASRAPLYWLLRHVHGLDVVDAQDALCDGPNDKGIDAIHVDDTDKTIYILQSKRREKCVGTLGDTELKTLVGTVRQLATPEGAEVVATTGNAELRNLILRHDLVTRLQSDFRLRGVLVTNSPADAAATTFLKTQVESEEAIELWDLVRLYKARQHLMGSEYVAGPAYLNTNHRASFTHSLDDNVRIIVALVPAKDIAALPGIDDNTIFDHNVRGPLGNTRINKDIRRTIADQDEHPLFPAYHNGLTIICKRLHHQRGRLELRNLSIVNGCQSAKALAANKANLTSDLRVLVKIINADPESSPIAYELTDKITQRSNNQNSITMRDLRSTDAKQRELVDEFRELFGPQIVYDIRRGERPKAELVIPNDLAAQQLVSFYLKEPWDAHKKTETFETKYDLVFSRSVHAEHIFLTHMAYDAAVSQRQAIDDPSVASYQLTVFVLMFLARCVLDQHEEERDVLSAPGTAVGDPTTRKRIRACLEGLMRSIVVDLNFYVRDRKQEDEFWDYRKAFKRKADVSELGNEVVKAYLKEVARNPSRKVDLTGGRVPA